MPIDREVHQPSVGFSGSCIRAGTECGERIVARCHRNIRRSTIANRETSMGCSG